MHRPSWDDLRYILAVAEAGSVAAAARRIGVNHATLLRHVGSFEARHEVRLFERLPSGYALTAEGADVVDALRDIEARVSDVERRVTGSDRRPEGRLRITTTDSVLEVVVSPPLASFHARYPKITVEVVVTGGRLDLARREADIAIRPSSHPPDELVGIEVSRFGFAVYASEDYLRGREDLPLNAHRWLVLHDLLRHAPPVQWMQEHIPQDRVVFRADSFVAIGQAAGQGLGAAVLPCCYGDRLDNLVRFAGPLEESEVSLWLLTHRELRRSATVRAFIDFYLPILRRKSKALAGR